MVLGLGCSWEKQNAVALPPYPGGGGPWGPWDGTPLGARGLGVVGDGGAAGHLTPPLMPGSKIPAGPSPRMAGMGRVATGICSGPAQSQRAA